jgi:hypothetical protein
MNSLPTIDQINLENFGQVVRKISPELYLIHIALKETGVNPLVLPKIIRSIANMEMGSGYGKIQIFMERKTITNINGEEKVLVNERAVVEE